MNLWITIERGKDYLRFFLDLITGRRQAAELTTAQRRAAQIAPYLDLATPKTIVDLGSGSLRPQYRILRNAGHRVVGVDLVNMPERSLKSSLYEFARWLFDRGLPSAVRGNAESSLICADVSRIPLPNDSADLVTSVAAFEHFLDVPRVLDEAVRVLRPGGVLWIAIHLFTSLSGGHNVAFRLGPITDLPPGVEPWDHLLDYKIPSPVPLNRWRMHQYVEAVEARFELLGTDRYATEGEGLLTTEREARLAEYSREELLTSTFVIYARKR